MKGAGAKLVQRARGQSAEDALGALALERDHREHELEVQHQRRLGSRRSLLGDLRAGGDWGALAAVHHGAAPVSTDLGREDRDFFAGRTR